MWCVRRCKFVAEMARTRQSVLDENDCCSYCDVVVTTMSSPWTLVVFVVTAVSCDCSRACFSISATCWRCKDGGAISMPRMTSRISDCVRDATLTLFFLP